MNKHYAALPILSLFIFLTAIGCGQGFKSNPVIDSEVFSQIDEYDQLEGLQEEDLEDELSQEESFVTTQAASNPNKVVYRRTINRSFNLYNVISGKIEGPIRIFANGRFKNEVITDYEDPRYKNQRTIVHFKLNRSAKVDMTGSKKLNPGWFKLKNGMALRITPKGTQYIYKWNWDGGFYQGEKYYNLNEVLISGYIYRVYFTNEFDLLGTKKTKVYIDNR